MLILKDVKKYYKNIKAVDGISFKVKKGEVFGLIGANGAGKSTTIAMTATLLKPDCGDILYEGKSIIKNPKEIRRHLGYVPQDIALYSSLTGKDNLKFWANAYHVPKEEIKGRMEEISQMIGFTEEMLNQKVNTYSGGMKRRLNLGAALLHHPDMVILDEPTVGMDIKARNQILDSVKQLSRKGTTILYCGHYMEEVEKISDTICILEQGKVLLCQSKESLLNSGGGYRTLESLYNELLIDN